MMMKKRFVVFVCSFCLLHFHAISQYVWTQKADYSGPRTSAVAFSTTDAGFIGTGYDSTSFKRSFASYNPLLNTWIQDQSIGGTSGSGLSRDMAAGFSIGTNGYIGTGQGANPYMNDFW